jgi:hypothetical protein
MICRTVVANSCKNRWWWKRSGRRRCGPGSGDGRKDSKFPGVAVTTERRGPDDGDGGADGVVTGRGGDDRADSAVPKRGGDGGGGGQSGGGVVPTMEEEWDGAVPEGGSEGRAADAIPRCSDGVEAVGVAAVSKKALEILSA